jgi:hypothetical protein
MMPGRRFLLEAKYPKVPYGQVQAGGENLFIARYELRWLYRCIASKLVSSAETISFTSPQRQRATSALECTDVALA